MCLVRVSNHNLSSLKTAIPFLWKELARPDDGQRVRVQHGHRGLQHATADPLGEVLASKAQSCAGFFPHCVLDGQLETCTAPGLTR